MHPSTAIWTLPTVRPLETTRPASTRLRLHRAPQPRTSHNQWTISRTCNVSTVTTRSGRSERAKTHELLMPSPHPNPDSKNKGASRPLTPASVQHALEFLDLWIVVPICALQATFRVSTRPMTVRLIRSNRPVPPPRATVSSKSYKWSVSLWIKQSTPTTVMWKHSREWLRMSVKRRSLPRLSVSSWLRARRAPCSNKELSN